MKLVVLVNTLQAVNSAVYANHCQFWSYMGKKHKDDTLIFLTPHRMAIDTARNWAAKVALEHEADYLMFIDDDVLIEPNTFDVLASRDKDVIMALTFIRGTPFKPMLFKAHPQNEYALTTYDDYEEYVTNSLVECEAVGFSCCLIKTELLKKLTQPYFVTGVNNTEDIYFCVEAKKQVEDVSIFTDVSVPTGHLVSPEAVMPSTVKQLREYYKSLEAPKVEFNGDNTLSYVEACLANVR